MSTTLFIVQLLNGLQLGVLLFLIAAGLTLVFGVMDFINLAHGVQYMLGAYLAVMFYAATGHFLLALMLALAAALAFGLLLEFAIFRHLYQRNHLDHVIATFGIILFLNSGVKLVWGAAPLNLPIPELFSGSVRLIDGLLYPAWRIVIIVSGLAVAAALYLLISYTRTGMLVRAGATDAPMVSALGINIRRLFMVVFGFGSMLAGFAGIMIAPILSVEPGMGDTVLILAFVVIVIGGIGSIRGAFFAALLIGVVDTLGRSFSVDLLRIVMGPSQARTVGPAIASMLIYLLMAVVLYIRPSGLFPATGRRDDSPGHALHVHSDVPPWRSVAGLVVPTAIFTAFVLIPLMPAGSGHILNVVTRVMIFSIAALSLDLLVGYGGLISFGHGAFIGLGAYAVGILAAHGFADAAYALPAALLVSAAFAYVTGMVALRTQGVYFIMITLAFSQMAFFTASSLAPYGGDDGLTIQARNTVAGWALLNGDKAFYYFVLAWLLATFLFCRMLVASRFGRVLRGSMENPTRMAAMGFHVYRFQLATYVIAGAIGGLSGFLLANATEFVSPSYMSWQRSGELIIMVVLGGMGMLTGAIIGTAAYILSEEFLAGFTEHWQMIFGPLLVLAVLYVPNGLRGALAALSGVKRRG
jgi:branched-chain amino acid transport system permease protein